MSPSDIPEPLLSGEVPATGRAGSSLHRPPGTRTHTSFRRDLVVVVGLTVGSFLLASSLELNEALLRWSRSFESLQLDELPFTFLVFALCFAWFSWRRRAEADAELDKRLAIERELERSEQQSRLLSRRCIEIQETERRNLARELHDELGQYLNAIKIDAVTIRERTNGALPDIHASATSIVELSDHVYGVVRLLVGRLRPVGLDELGLVAAMRHCIDGWRQRLPGVAFAFTAPDRVEGIDEAGSIALYRALQECLTNAARHARAGRVDITLAMGEAGRSLVLQVCDNGCGMDPARRGSGLGLAGMRERLEALGGELAVDSLPGQGLTARASIPLAAGRPADARA